MSISPSQELRLPGGYVQATLSKKRSHKTVCVCAYVSFSSSPNYKKPRVPSCYVHDSPSKGRSHKTACVCALLIHYVPFPKSSESQVTTFMFPLRRDVVTRQYVYVCCHPSSKSEKFPSITYVTPPFEGSWSQRIFCGYCFRFT